MSFYNNTCNDTPLRVHNQVYQIGETGSYLYTDYDTKEQKTIRFKCVKIDPTEVIHPCHSCIFGKDNTDICYQIAQDRREGWSSTYIHPKCIDNKKNYVVTNIFIEI